jgi:hypothetical protein
VSQQLFGNTTQREETRTTRLCVDRAAAIVNEKRRKKNELLPASANSSSAVNTLPPSPYFCTPLLAACASLAIEALLAACALLAIEVNFIRIVNSRRE